MSESNDRWKTLFRVDGIAASILLAYSLATFVVLFAAGGQPETAREGFDMLRENRFVGLLRLDILTVLTMPLYYVLFLGFFVSLRRSGPSSVAIAALLGCAGLTLVLATPSAFSWLTLSDKFASATDEGRKMLLLAAGEAVMASDMWHGTSAWTGGLLAETGALLASLAMLEGRQFGRATAWTGIVTHGLELVRIPLLVVVPAAGLALMVVAGPLYLVWFPLLARDFFRLSRPLHTRLA